MTLYRTYRSQRFSDLLGQEAAVTTLQAALELGKVSHAYLFSGPRGTGKTSTARIFSRALVCLSPVRQPSAKGTPALYEPCNACAVCFAILENRTTDLIEIDAASNRGIEDIRSLREQMTYHPVQLSRKVYIIDEVHMLTNEAFNALLKSLEEPPDYCLFILATTELHKVPITIRSRCQLLRFERGSVEDIQKKLDSIAASENMELEPGVTRLIAKHADGGFRDAETLLETLATRHRPLTADTAEKSLGLLPEEAIEKLMSSCLSGDSAEVLEILKRLRMESTAGGERIIGQLIELLRSYLYQSHSGIAMPLVPPPSLAHLTFALEQLLEAFLLQRSSPVPLLPLEIACLSIADYPTSIDRQPVEKNKPKTAPAVAAIEERHIPEPTAPEEPKQNTVHRLPIEDPPPAPAEDARSKDIRAAWKKMIDRVCQENNVLGQALKLGVFHTAEAGVITIHVRFKFHADKMNEKKNRQRIHELLEELTGSPWEVTYEVNPSVVPPKPRRPISTGVEDALAVFSPPAN